MSFDWMSFATGFLERTQEIRSDRQEKAEQYEEDQRRAAERNAATISRRRAYADRVTGYANYLQQNGFSEAQIQAVISSGPEAIRTVTEQVQSEVQRNNNRPLGAADVETMLNMPEGFEPVDMSLEEFINTTYNLTPVAPQEEQQEFGFFDRLGGRDQMARARERLASTPFSEGMSIADINRAAQRADYEAVQPGTFATFAAAYEYNITEDGVAFMRDSSRLLDQLEASPSYNDMAINPDGTMSIEEVDEAKRQMRINAIEPLINGYAERDPAGFIDAHESQLRISLGDEYVEQLKERLGLTAPEPEEEVPGGDTGGDTGNAGTETDTLLAPQPDVTTEVPTMVAPRADTIGIEEEADSVEGDIPEPNPDTTVRVEEGDQYTYAQWQEMSREERRAAGLPLGEGAAQLYFNRFGSGIGEFTPIEDMVGPAGEGDPEQTRVYQELSSQGVDDTSIALLNSHGSDMLNYAMEKGATTPEELLQALTEWGQENNISMPFDKSALIVALKSVIDNQ